MSDEHLDIDFRFNTPEAKRDLHDIGASIADVNTEAEKGIKPLKEREGIVERLKRRIGELRDEQNKATSVTGIARYNSELQKYEQELIRVSRAGRSGFDSNGQAMLSNEGILQRLHRAAALYQKGMLEATRTDNIEKYSQKLALVNAEISKLSKGANIGGGSNFNGLQHSINQIGRELPAITYGFQTFAMGISNNIPLFADEIGRLRKENEALAASGQKGVPIWKQLIGGLLSWQTALTIGVTLLTVYGKEIGNFFAEFFKGKTTINQSKRDFEALNSVMSESSKIASQEIAQLKVLSTVASDVTKSTKERKEAAKQLQELSKAHNVQLKTEAILAGNAAAQYRELAKSILEAARSKAAQSKIEENEAKRLDLEFQRQKVQNANANEKARYARQGDDPDKVISNGVLGTSTVKGLTVEDKQLGSDIRASRAFKEIDTEMKILDKTSEYLLKFVKVEEQKEKAKDAGTGENIFDRVSDSSKDLIDKIAKLDAEYSRKTLPSEEEEKQALRDKFAEFRKLIEEENEKILAYNNKYKKNFSTIDINALNPIQDKAESNLNYTQNTNMLQKQYEEEYKIFQQYEELKKSTNVQYANERFATQLDSIKSFEQRLNDELSKIDPNTTNELERKRLEGLNKVKTELFNKQQAEEDKRLMESLELVKSFNDKRLEIEKKYQDARKALGDKITPEQEQELKRKESMDVSKLASEELQQSDAWMQLFSDLDRLTVAQIDKLVQEIEKDFNNLSVKFNPIDLDAIRKKLQEAKDEVIEKNPFKAVGDSLKSIFKGASDESGQSSEEIKDQWVKLSKATNKSFDFIADAVNSTEFLKDALGDTGATAISALQGVSLAAVAVSTAIKSAEKASVILAIIQAALVVVQAVFSFLDGAAKKRNEQLQKEQEYYDTLSETFDILIDKQKKLFSEQSGKSAMEAYKDALDMVNSKLVANRKGLEAWFAQGASWKSHSNWYKYDEELGNILSRQKLLNMTGKEWEELLRNQPELWAKLPSEVREYAQSVIDAKEQTYELRVAMQEAFAGFSLDDLKSELQNLYTQVDLTNENIGESFYKHMQKAILQLTQTKSMSTAMEKWYKNLVENLDDGDLSSSEADRLKAEYQSMVEKGRKEYEAAMKAIGYDSSGSSSSSLKSEGIERVSEQTATELMGVNRAHLDVSKRHLLAFEKAMEFWQYANNVLIQQLKHQAAIEQNTADTVTKLDLALVELKGINNNTKQQSTRAYTGL